MLIIGFFGVGKTTASKMDCRITDLTEEGSVSLFDLKNALKNNEIVVVDPVWKKIVLASNEPFYVVIPKIDRKQEYLSNYKTRYDQQMGAGDKDFIFCMNIGWNIWIHHLQSLPSLATIELEEGEWLIDAIKELNK